MTDYSKAAARSSTRLRPVSNVCGAANAFDAAKLLGDWETVFYDVEDAVAPPWTVESLSRGGDGTGGDEIVAADDRVIPGSAVGGGILAAAVRAMIRAPRRTARKTRAWTRPSRGFSRTRRRRPEVSRARARRELRRRKTPSGRGGRRRDARGCRSALFPPALARRAPARRRRDARCYNPSNPRRNWKR